MADDCRRLADMCYSRERRRMYDRQYTHLLDRSIAIKKSLGVNILLGKVALSSVILDGPCRT